MVDMTGDADFELDMEQRLLYNELDWEGSETIRITGLDQSASSLQ
jgi:hypothetical protein